MLGLRRNAAISLFVLILIGAAFVPALADDDPYDYESPPDATATPTATATPGGNGNDVTATAGPYVLSLPMVARDLFPGDENFAAAGALLGVGAMPGGFFAVAEAGASINALNPIPGICPVNAQLGMTGAAAAVFAKTLPPEAIATTVLIYSTPQAALAAAQALGGALDCFVAQGVGQRVQGLVINSITKTPLDLAGLPGFAAGARLVAQTGTIIPVGVTLDAIYVVSGRYLFAIARAGVGATFPPGETVALAQAGAGLIPPQ